MGSVSKWFGCICIAVCAVCTIVTMCLAMSTSGKLSSGADSAHDYQGGWILQDYTADATSGDIVQKVYHDPSCDKVYVYKFCYNDSINRDGPSSIHVDVFDRKGQLLPEDFTAVDTPDQNPS